MTEEEMIKRIPKRYHPHEVESQVKNFWNEQGIQQKVERKASEGEPYYFLDGPPYASGRIHIGTAWNKVLKDVAIRYYTQRGFSVRRQPGWDMHGLPIEVKAEEKLGINIKREIQEFGVENFIRECKNLALENKEIMEKQMKNLGVWMDWKHPYMTIQNEWIESEWAVLKGAWEQKLLYKDLKVMHWCKRCQTALAEHEVEYEEIRDPSIYVKFPLANKKDEFVLVWTTTPWTLPANMAVLLHPTTSYVQVNIEDERWWIAEKRLDEVMEAVEIKNYSIVKRKNGSDLKELKYIHPFLEEYDRQKNFDERQNVHTLIVGEGVELTEGTGCVHIAPGHGKEDLELGKQYNLPVYSPVREDGEFKEGKWAGMDVKEADARIIEKLKHDDLLVASGEITHRYPICWRCKSPLIFRSTEQWFLNIEELKEDLISRNYQKVEWIPDWTRDRFLDGVRKVGDWCISRQRFWNAPIPLWRCEECEHEEMIGNRSELKEKAKSEVDGELDLHRPYVDEIKLECSKCGGSMMRIPDVLDVWFDSGVASWASLHYPKKEELFENFWPCDLIIEGQDQVLKWFYVQQILGLIYLGEIPYRRVVMHGFVLDKSGRAMHKSLGNIISPEEVVETYGVDLLRLYLLSATALGSDMKFNYREVERIENDLRILWNLFYLATRYMEMDEFSLSTVRQEKLERHFIPEDKWIVSHTKGLASELDQKLRNMEIPKAVRLLLEYGTEDLSRWYGKLIRSRLWIEEEDPAKEAVYLTFYKVFKILLPLLGIFAPHFAEFLYQRTIRKIDRKAPESVHLLDFPDKGGRDTVLEDHMEIAREVTKAGLAARQKSNVKLRWPLPEAVIETNIKNVKKAVKSLKTLLKDTLNVKSLDIKEVDRRVVCHPLYTSLGPKYKEDAEKVARKLEELNGNEVRRKLQENGFYQVNVDGKSYEISSEDVKFELLPPEYYVSGEIPGGHIFLLTKRGDQLKAEGYVRDLVRRIQEMRKEMDLEMEERIIVQIAVPSNANLMQDLIRDEWTEYIKHETRAKELSLSNSLSGSPTYKREWKIADEQVKIGIDI